MRDSRTGSYGALCLICTVGLKYICIVSIDPGAVAALSFISDYEIIKDMNPLYLNACEKGKVLLFMCAIGRWSQVLGAALSSYARDEGGTGKIIIEKRQNKACFIFLDLTGYTYIFILWNYGNSYILYSVHCGCFVRYLCQRENWRYDR